MNEVYISLGSNMGDRFQTLREAIRLLTEHDEVRVVELSSIYETEPVGYTEQDSFFNMVALIQTTLDATKILSLCQSVEKALGRVRTIRWGPRTVDLDILLFNHDNIETENLIVPHPRMHERGFVLIPLVEIAPDAVHPVSKQAFQELADLQKEGIKRWTTVESVEEFVRSEN